jgi:uncharacterized membrane protein
MSDLIVIGYPNEDTAQRVYDELMKLENDLVVDLADAAIIRRDRSGKPWPGAASAGCSGGC